MYVVSYKNVIEITEQQTPALLVGDTNLPADRLHTSGISWTESQIQ